MGCRLIDVFLFFLLPSSSIRVTQIPVLLDDESESELEKYIVLILAKKAHIAKKIKTLLSFNMYKLLFKNQSITSKLKKLYV